MATGHETVMVNIPIFARFNGKEYEIGSIDIRVEIKVEASDGA